MKKTIEVCPNCHKYEHEVYAGTQGIWTHQCPKCGCLWRVTRRIVVRQDMRRGR
jgi:ssDNA-binding Zn-finger/Zn-ribbon topoisomerase 1